MVDFTHLQGQYLAFIHTYAKLNRQAPAEADIQRYFGVTPPVVHQMVLTLHKKVSSVAHRERRIPSAFRCRWRRFLRWTERG
jgi:Mn-dependent DtxR family transcriptional regulator